MLLNINVAKQAMWPLRKGTTFPGRKGQVDAGGVGFRLFY